MSSTGINYYMNTLGIDTGAFSIFYTFTGLAGGFLPSVSLGNPIYSGQLFNDGGQFASVQNSGLFSGNNYLQVTNVTTGLSGDTTILMVYNRPTGVNGGVIFSSLTGTPGNYPSGWLLGVNDANRLYFEYYNNTGPVVITSNKVYGQQNAVAMNLTTNSLSFNYYDVDLKQLETENFVVQSQYLLFSNQWYLGKTFAPWLASRPFTGFMDHFLYFNTTISNSNITRLFSGIFSSPVTTAAVSGTIITTGITGYQLVPTGNTGIQSYTTTFSGFNYLNSGYDCGTYPVFITGILTNPVFGTWGSGYALVPLTGTTSGYVLSLAASTGIVINSGYLANFGMDFVSYLWDRTQVNNQEIIVLTGVYNLSWLDQSAIFDNIIGEFSTIGLYSSGNLNAFRNGVFQVESGYTTLGQYYNTNLIAIADYFINGTQFLYTNNYVSGSDVEYYDDNQQQNRLIVWPGWSGTGLLTGATGLAVQNIMVFLNGQKLISGIDYQIVTGSYNFSGSSGITGIYGDLVFVAQYTGFLNQIGTYDRYSGPKFTRHSSLYYLNGIRIDPSLYIESSVVDLISGLCIYDSGIVGMNNNNENLGYWF